MSSVSLRLELIQSTSSLPNSELSSPLSAQSLQNSPHGSNQTPIDSPHLRMQSSGSGQPKRANSLRTKSMEDCRNKLIPRTNLE